MLLPLIFTVMSSAAGASNSPGISSVNLIRLIGEEPSLVIVTVADKSCLLYDGRTVFEYFLATLASRTSNVDASSSSVPSVL